MDSLFYILFIITFVNIPVTTALTAPNITKKGRYEKTVTVLIIIEAHTSCPILWDIPPPILTLIMWKFHFFNKVITIKLKTPPKREYINTDGEPKRAEEAITFISIIKNAYLLSSL